MKTGILMFVMLMITSLQALAQQDASFIKENKVWYCSTDWGSCTSRFFFSSDTILNDVSYHKLWVVSRKYYADTLAHYVACAREEDMKVFYVEDGSDKEIILYDFGLERGRILYDAEGKMGFEYFYRSYYWSRIGVFYGIPRRVVAVCGGGIYPDGEEDYVNGWNLWVEGIGTNGNIFSKRHGEFECCYEGDELVFTRDDFRVANTLSDIKIADADAGKESSSPVYDLSGRQIQNTSLTRGIYIQNGRKFVVK